MSDFNDTSYPKARMAHACDECGRQINPSEHYSRTAAVWEGEFFTNVACLHCAVGRYVMDEHCSYYSEGFYGGLSWHVGECDEGGAASLRVAVGVRRKWKRFDGAGLMAYPAATEVLQKRDKRLAKLVAA